MKLFEQLKYHVPRLSHQLGKPVALGGHQFRLNGYHPDRLARGIESEAFLLPVLARTLQARRGTFLDVGANIGQTLFKLLAVDPQRSYVGFEPQLDCCFYSEQFLRRNGLRNAQVVPIALSNADGMVPLFRDRPFDDTASIQPSHAYSPDQERPHMSWVAARVGDELLAEMGIGEIAAIKIDVEGFELEVMSGLRETLAKQRPPVLFEVLSNYFWDRHVGEEVGREKSERAASIYSLLEEAGYSIFRIDAHGNERPIDSFDLDAKPPPDLGNEGRDYIARPID